MDAEIILALLGTAAGGAGVVFAFMRGQVALARRDVAKKEGEIRAMEKEWRAELKAEANKRHDDMAESQEQTRSLAGSIVRASNRWNDSFALLEARVHNAEREAAERDPADATPRARFPPPANDRG